MDNFNYGKNLRKVRHLNGISQKEMALNLNISQTTYSRIEHHATLPEPELRNQIAEVLNVLPLELMPPTKPLEPKLMSAIRGSGLGDKAKEILNAPMGKILIYGAAAALLSAAYDIGRGFCLGFGTSAETARVMSWVSALGMFVYLYYWIRKIKRVG